MMTELKRLEIQDIEIIKAFFAGVFTKEPWNDDWSDENQLDSYIVDLIGNPNSLTFGFYCDQTLVGLAMGNMKHWYTGTEYCIDEFCIQTERQRAGLGKLFLEAVEAYLLKREIHMIFLQTDRDVPAYSFYLKNGFIDLADHVALVKKF